MLVRIVSSVNVHSLCLQLILFRFWFQRQVCPTSMNNVKCWSGTRNTTSSTKESVTPWEVFRWRFLNCNRNSFQQSHSVSRMWRHWRCLDSLETTLGDRQEWFLWKSYGWQFLASNWNRYFLLKVLTARWFKRASTGSMITLFCLHQTVALSMKWMLHACTVVANCKFVHNNVETCFRFML